MESITLHRTKSTPKIHFDAAASVLVIQGESYPENAFAFYRPLIEWIEQYLEQLQGSALLELHLTYLNTSSTRSILNLLDRFDIAYKEGKSLKVHWNYLPEDDRSLEAGEEFQEDLSVPFIIKPLENSNEEID